MREVLQLISPYYPILALNRMEFPEGFACHHLNPIRYIVREASHPVISATVARPLRRLVGIHQVYVNMCPFNYIHIQLCDIVSRLTPKLSFRPPALSLEIPKNAAAGGRLERQVRNRTA